MKIASIGYGKMDREIEKAALDRGREIVSIISINNQDDFEPGAFKSTDVVTKFTNPMVAYSSHMRAFRAGVKLVSGNTGRMVEHGDEAKELCNKGGKTLFWSSNFSLGVTIFSAVNKHLAKIMNQFSTYDMTMSEAHHAYKLDAPSGTVITLAEGIPESMEHKNVRTKGEAYPANELPIHSIREGEAFGIYAIRYDSEADSISITYNAKNRGGFALGAVLAAKYTTTHEDYLGMSNLFLLLKG